MAAWDRPVCGVSPSTSPLGVDEAPDLPGTSAYGLVPGRPSPGRLTLLRPPIAQTSVRWYRNIDLFPISYAFRPRLRGRLTLGRRPLPRKPEAYGERDSHPLYRYSCQHHLLWCLQRSSRYAFADCHNAPLPLVDQVDQAAASVECLAPLDFRRRCTRPVSYYAFFKGWLLLSQPPGCFSTPTSFPTEHSLGDLSRRSGLFPSRRRNLSPDASLPRMT